MYTIRDAASLLGLSVSQVNRLIAQSRLETVGEPPDRLIVSLEGARPKPIPTTHPIRPANPLDEVPWRQQTFATEDERIDAAIRQAYAYYKTYGPYVDPVDESD